MRGVVCWFVNKKRDKRIYKKKEKKKVAPLKANMLFFHIYANTVPHKQTHASRHAHQRRQIIIIPLLEHCSISRDQSSGDLALPNTLRKSAESRLRLCSCYLLLLSLLRSSMCLSMCGSPAVCIDSLQRILLSFPILCSKTLSSSSALSSLSIPLSVYLSPGAITVLHSSSLLF